jgi:hypothetical protein
MSEPNKVKSDVFVGRENELQRFRHILTPESKVHIFNIHTNGGGGIGKTQLLLQMQKICKNRPNIVYGNKLIDFYHTENHSKLGVMEQITQNLEREQFSEFESLTKEYRETEDAISRKELLRNIEAVFFKEYKRVSEKTAGGKKVIVLFFDTYEVVQNEASEISFWLEDMLFPKLNKNTRLIISGRNPLETVKRDAVSVQEIELGHFNLSETIDFLKNCFTKEELEDKKIESDSVIEMLHHLVDGRPILIALLVDWLKYDFDDVELDAELLLERIGIESGKSPASITKARKEDFEKALINPIGRMRDPEDRAVTHMAFAYRRMTPEMFSFITDIPIKDYFTKEKYNQLVTEYPDAKIALETIVTEEGDKVFINTEDIPETLKKQMGNEVFDRFREHLKKTINKGTETILLKSLRPLSFVKYKDFPEQTVLLHDEMRDLVNKHWWKEHGNVQDIQNGMARRLVEYYDKEVERPELKSSIIRSTYYAERLYYSFFAGTGELLKYFVLIFDERLKGYHINTFL